MFQDRYRELLKGELSKRCEKRAGYSLRAFARDLGLDPAQLSRILSGKKNLSLLSAQSVSEKLFSASEDREVFVAAVELAIAKKPSLRDRALKKLSSLHSNASSMNEAMTLSLESIKVISDWYHFAILDLTKVKGVAHTPAAFAQYLGISEIEVKLAIERMTKLGLMEKRGTRFVKTKAKLVTPSDTPNVALRRFHSQMIEKAVHSLETQTVHERYVVGKTLSIRKEDIPKYKSLVEDFFSKVSSLVLASGTSEPNALYQLNVQFFDLRRRK